MLSSPTVIDTEVLIVGGGGAGARAALEANGSSADVVLCLKDHLETAGATAYRIVELGGFNLPPDDDSQSEENYFTDMVDAALGVSDPQLARVIAAEARSELFYLESLGVAFPKIDNEYLMFKGCFASKKRTHILPGHGHAIMEKLAAKIRASSIKVMENTFITALIKDQDRICGAVGLLEDGRSVFIRAPAIVLTAGGAGRMFKLNMNPVSITGDGYALAYRAGATITNMEFMQFGLATVFPTYNLIGNWLFPLKPKITNDVGDPIIEKYLPPSVSTEMVIEAKTGHFPFSSRDDSKYIEISIQKETTAGRVGKHGGVFLDFRGAERNNLKRLPPESQRVWQMAKDWWLKRGLDADVEPLEVAVFAHAVNGGPLIDCNGTTDVSGLFAAGENAAGPHGADRLGGNMLVTSQVFGRRAGRAAAKYAKSVTNTTLSSKHPSVESELIKVMKRGRNGSIQPNMLIERLQAAMWLNMVVIRSMNRIQNCSNELQEISDMRNRLGVESAETFRKCIELDNMIEVSRMMLTAAAKREESRGSHYREDFPSMNNDRFNMNIFLRRDNSKDKFALGSIEEFRNGTLDFIPVI